MPLGRELTHVKRIRCLACAGCCLFVFACAPSQPLSPPSLSIDYVYTTEGQPLFYPSQSQPPRALVVRWDPRGIPDSQAEAIAERQCLAWNRDAKPEGAKSQIGNMLTQRYVCVASPGKSPADEQLEKPQP